MYKNGLIFSHSVNVWLSWFFLWSLLKWRLDLSREGNWGSKTKSKKKNKDILTQTLNCICNKIRLLYISSLVSGFHIWSYYTELLRSELKKKSAPSKKKSIHSVGVIQSVKNLKIKYSMINNINMLKNINATLLNIFFMFFLSRKKVNFSE